MSMDMDMDTRERRRDEPSAWEFGVTCAWVRRVRVLDVEVAQHLHLSSCIIWQQ